MKRFTVKDFISYNAPCFSCGEKIILKIGHVGEHIEGYLRPTVKPDHTVIDLKVSYHHTLQLFIYHQTNKIISTDIRGLTDYLYSHKLFLQSFCDKCYTSVKSHFLTFNLDKGYVEPVGISSERLMVTDDDNMYAMDSSFMEEKSIVTVSRISKATPVSPVWFHLPLLPLYKIKTKERLVNKIKTYLTFS
jgi:hypothetical protein